MPNPNPRGLSDSSAPHAATPMPHSGIQTDPQVTLVSKQLLIEYGPLKECKKLQPKTIETQRELCQLFNSWINRIAFPEVSKGHPPPALSCAVHNVSIFDHPTLLLDFDTANSKTNFAKMIDKNDFLLKEISTNAHVCPRTYAVIFRFVSCNGPFDLSLDNHLCNIESENNLPINSIMAALWCKCPNRRLPNQTTTTLKVACSNPHIANHLLTGCI